LFGAWEKVVIDPLASRRFGRRGAYARAGGRRFATGTTPNKPPDLLTLPFDMPLQEREEALAVVDSLLGDAQAGRGRVLVLEGPPGIGKTRLLEAIHARAKVAGMRAFRARAGELEQEFSCGVVRQLFEAPLAGPARAELLSGAAELARPLFDIASGELLAADPAFGTLHGLYWLTVNLAEPGPALISVDDLHWCDAASLRYLAYLVRRLDGLSVLLVATMRPRHGREPGVIDEITDDPSTTVLRLPPLSSDGVASLLSARLGADPDPEFSSTVHEWTAGNPLLLRELIAAAVARRIEATPGGAKQVRELAPEGVGRLVLRRIAPLGSQALALAEAIAVLGEDCGIDQAADVAGLSRADASRAVDALQGIEVLSRGEHLAFAHPLVLRAIYDDMDASRRAALHATVADSLAAAGAAPARVATHLLAVDPRGDRAVVESLRAAAREAMTQAAPDTAATYLARAIAEPPAADDQAAVMLELGLAQARAQPAESVPTLSDVLETTDDDDLLARAAVALAAALHQLDRDDEGGAIALRTMSRIADEAVRRRVEVQYVFTGIFRPAEYPAAKRLLDRIAVAEGADDPLSRQLLGLRATHAAREGTRPELALELARAALAGDVLVRANIPSFGIPCDVLLYRDEFDEALAGPDAALAQARRTGHLAMYTIATWVRARILLGRGDLSDAESEAEALLAPDASPAHIIGMPLGPDVLGQIALLRGDIAHAAEHLDYSDEIEEPGSWGWAVNRGRRGLLRAAQGRLDAALDDLMTVGAWGAPLGYVNPAIFPWRSEAALVLSRLGRRDEALELAHEEVALARVWGAPRALGGALCTAGLVVGDEEGLDLLREATDVLDNSPAALVRARAATELGAALRRTNRRADARAPLGLGLELAERSGATALAERARAELVATGARPRRAARTGVDSLTASERRVARMAAEGLTNRDIAQTLFVTPKTVEVHLSHSYQKLGIQSRSQLLGALGHADELGASIKH
jgi:DNA-binding CsgD family transcriptional regulator